MVSEFANDWPSRLHAWNEDKTYFAIKHILLLPLFPWESISSAVSVSPLAALAGLSQQSQTEVAREESAVTSCFHFHLRSSPMKKNRALIGICIAVGITTGLGFKFRQSQAQLQPGQQQSQAIPEFEIYRQLFHHHVTMKKKAEELEKQGKDARFFREFYQREAKLSDDQASAFDAVASDCEQQVARQDAKAKLIL
jgi:hypothetical protein